MKSQRMNEIRRFGFLVTDSESSSDSSTIIKTIIESDVLVLSDNDVILRSDEDKKA